MTSGHDEQMRTGLDAYFEAHQFPDTDNSPSSLHHTLGPEPRQASPGNHQHPAKAVKVWKNNNKNLAYNTPYVIYWTDYTFWDTEYFRRGADTREIVILKQGLYTVSAQASIAGNADGTRQLRPILNGTALVDFRVPPALGATTFPAWTRTFRMDPGDVLKFDVTHFAVGAGTLLALNTGINRTYATIVFEGILSDTTFLNGAWADAVLDV